MDTQSSQNEDLKRRLKEATDIIKSRDETIAARHAQIAGLQSELPCHMRRRIHACYRQACECWQNGLCTQIIIYKGKYDLHRKVLLPSPVALPSHTSTTCSRTKRTHSTTCSRTKRTHSSKRTHASNTSNTCSRSRSINSALSYDANTTTPS